MLTATERRRLGLKTVELARQSLGVREDQGRNWGRWVRLYLQAAGLVFPAPWCAAFVSFKVNQAAGRLGLKARWPRRAPTAVSSSGIYRWAKREGLLLREPEAGCVFLRRGGPTGYRHTGLVADVDRASRTIRTVEGNVRDQVTQRTLPWAGLAFIRVA